MHLRMTLLTLTLFLGLACGKGTYLPSSPAPIPEPTPAPVPAPVLAPIQVVNGHFSQPLKGIAFCCEDALSWGWPLINEAGLDLIASIDGNWATMRLGPFTREGESPEFEAYSRTGSKYNLSEWNPLFWDRVSQLLQYATSLGITVEVDIIDGWALKHPGNAKVSPWSPSMNLRGLDARGCSITHSSPLPIHVAWIKKVVQETGMYNVMYQIGNETDVCSSSLEWEQTIYDLVKEELHLMGFPERSVGTGNPRSGVVADYETWHGFGIPPVLAGGPVLINETDNQDHSVAEYIELIKRVQAAGAEMIYWRGPHSQGQFDEMLALYKDLE